MRNKIIFLFLFLLTFSFSLKAQVVSNLISKDKLSEIRYIDENQKTFGIIVNKDDDPDSVIITYSYGKLFSNYPYRVILDTIKISCKIYKLVIVDGHEFYRLIFFDLESFTKEENDKFI